MDASFYSNLETLGNAQLRDNQPGFEWALEKRDAPGGRFDRIALKRHDKRSGTYAEYYLDGSSDQDLQKLVLELNEKQYSASAQMMHLVESGAKLFAWPKVGKSPIDMASYIVKSFVIDVHQEGKGKNPLFNEFLAIGIGVLADIALHVLSTEVRQGTTEDLIVKGFKAGMAGKRGRDGKPMNVGVFEQCHEEMVDAIEEGFKRRTAQTGKPVTDATLNVFMYDVGKRLAADMAKDLTVEERKNEHQVKLYMNIWMKKHIPSIHAHIDVPEDVTILKQQLAAREKQIEDLRRKYESKPVSEAGNSGDLGKARGGAIKNFLGRMGFGGRGDKGNGAAI